MSSDVVDMNILNILIFYYKCPFILCISIYIYRNIIYEFFWNSKGNFTKHVLKEEVETDRVEKLF